ncbi:hypothetical protein [Streptomyces sp. NBC_01429]|uniref:hypothetical protein n=1 Tax=Streptomyces sp. NBC_01429 TaxID=2903862 RepID=UPI002E2A4515|nr:hypothetical protein [Streptomyces sp. NBC_01429]
MDAPRARKIAARTRATAQPSWPRPAVEPDSSAGPADENAAGQEELADIIPLEIFDARKEAEKWW